MHATYIIIGASAAGLNAAHTLVRLDKESTVMCISAERELPYNTCLLADLCASRIVTDRVYLHSPLNEPRLQFMLDTRVEVLDADKKILTLNTGQVLSYEKLLLTLGARPTLPAWFRSYAGTAPFFTFHTLRDVHALDAFIQSHKPCTAAVVGGGLTGLECADALSARGLRVTLIEREPLLLPGIASETLNNLLQKQLNERNVSARTGLQVQTASYDQKQGVQLLYDDGTVSSFDLLVCATGVQPNVELAQSAGIHVDHHGLVVNDSFELSVSDVYAAGDCCQVIDHINQQVMRNYTWADACKQGIYAAYAMANNPRPYPGALPLITSSFFGLQYAAYCPWQNLPAEYTVHEQIMGNEYEQRMLYAGTLRGFFLLGQTTRHAELMRSMMHKIG